MKPSEVFLMKREIIQEILRKYPVSNPRIFGSVARGEDNNNSDLDIMVDTLPGCTLFDLGGLQDELSIALGISIDVVLAKDVAKAFGKQVLEEAISIYEN